jgi:flagellar hook-length control protein FliK
MGLTVIPASAAGLLPANGTSTSAAVDALAGEFAALLSGELLGLKTDPSILANSAEKGERPELAGDGSSPALSLFASLFGHFDSKVAASAAPTASQANAEALVSGDARQRVPFTETGSELACQSCSTITGLADKTDVGLSYRPQLATTAAADRNASATAFSSQLAATLRSPEANIAGEDRAADIAPGNGIPPAAVNANPPASGLEKLTTGDTRSPAVNAHLHSAAWPQQFSDKIVWLARNDQQSAQLTINPPQLGPIQISLYLSGDQATIAFASPHAEVRQAIESAMPQLKEMLSSAGISLGQSNVGGNLQQPADNPFADAYGMRSADENAILPANENAANAAGSPVLHRGRGLVDLFA